VLKVWLRNQVPEPLGSDIASFDNIEAALAEIRCELCPDRHGHAGETERCFSGAAILQSRR
jgi:hypothetical protein